MKNIILFTLSFITILILPAPAQNNPAESDTSKIWPITEVEIQTIKKQIESVDLSEEIKNTIYSIYDEALKVLNEAKFHNSETVKYKQELEQAPVKLQEIRQLLEQPAKISVPQPPTDASVQQLDQWLTQAQATKLDAQLKVTQIDEEVRQRTERRKNIPQDIATLQKQLEGIQEKIKSTTSDDKLELIQANNILLQLKKLTAEKEVERYQKEIASYDARGELINARRDLAVRELAQADLLVKAWQKIVNDKRRQETQADVADAKKIQEQIAWSHDILKQLADENTKIAERRLLEKLPDKIESTTRDLDRIQKQIDSFSTDFINLSSKLAAAGMTHEMSLRLRKMRDSLPNIRELRKTIRSQLEDLSSIQVQLIELYEQRIQYDNIDPLIQANIAKITSEIENISITQIETDLRKLFTARRNYYTALEQDYDTYFDKLASLIEKERTLTDETEKITRYIDERILWIRSTTVLSHSDLSNILIGIKDLFALTHIKEFLRTLWYAALAAPIKCILGLLYIIIWVLIRRRFIKVKKNLGKIAARTYTYSFTPTLKAVGITLLLILPVPLILAWLYWILVSYLESPESVRMYAEGIKALAFTSLLIEFLRHLCKPNGLAHNHFAWPEQKRNRIQQNIRWSLPILFPLVFIVTSFGWSNDTIGQNSLGRLAFILLQLLLCTIAYRIFRPIQSITTDQITGENVHFNNKMELLKFYFLLAIPILLATLAFIGFYYTAVQLALSLWATLWLFLVLMLIKDLALRWILVSQRNLAIQKARKKREVLLEKIRQENQQNETPTEDQLPPEPELNISSISDQTKNLLHSVIIFALLLGLWLVWIPVIPALNVLNNIPIKGTVNLGDVLFAVLILIITFLIGRNLPGLLEIAILQKLPLQTGVSFAVTSVTKYIITIIGIVIAFDVIGIGWSKVQWLVAAVTVGLGFGLQEIFANFVSGLIILFERPIRVGDFVSVGNVDGKITRIRMRATTVTDWDRRELLVPNKEFITSQLINWTLSDPITRVVIPVGIAYGSDTQKARDLLLQVAMNSPLVLDDPKPQAIFRRFGESSLDFELRVFIPDRDRWPKLINEMHMQIDQAFREAKIEIAFPQRDIHVKSIHDLLSIKQKQNPEDKDSP